MKYLRKFNESFKEEDIHEICREYGIENYTINNGLVDISGDVDLFRRGLIKLPLNFGKISGYFNCRSNKLTSLEGSPTEVGSSFWCEHNNLLNLEGCPKYVGGNFYCNNNNLTTLIGCPLKVGGNFHCHSNSLKSLEGCLIEADGFYFYNNNLTTLEGCPTEVGDEFSCFNNPVYEIYKLFTDHKSYIDSLDYNYFRGENKINKIRFTQALEEIGKKCPENIEGYIWE